MYQEQVLKNINALANTLEKNGFRIVSGGTDNHLILVDVSKVGLNGKNAEKPNKKETKKEKEDDELSPCGDKHDLQGAAPYNFSLEKFSSDFINLLNLFSNSKNAFKITEHIEEKNLKKKENINEIILNKKDYILFFQIDY